MKLMYKYYDLFRFIPDEKKTTKLCSIAVNLYYDNLQYVPHNLITDEMCVKFVTDWKTLQYVPDHFKTAELCKLAVSKYGDNIRYVPHKLRTLELYTIAVYRSDWYIQYVPEDIRDAVRDSLGGYK